MRREEVLPLRRGRIDSAALTFRGEETKTGEPLELPLTRQLVALLEHCRAVAKGMPERARPWVFASETGASGHVHNPQYLYAPMTSFAHDLDRVSSGRARFPDTHDGTFVTP